MGMVHAAHGPHVGVLQPPFSCCCIHARHLDGRTGWTLRLFAWVQRRQLNANSKVTNFHVDQKVPWVHPYSLKRGGACDTWLAWRGWASAVCEPVAPP